MIGSNNRFENFQEQTHSCATATYVCEIFLPCALLMKYYKSNLMYQSLDPDGRMYWSITEYNFDCPSHMQDMVLVDRS